MANTTSEKIVSNRKNAGKSVGPKTAKGKASASQNARQHGILSSQLILPHENPQEYQALLSELLREF